MLVTLDEKVSNGSRPQDFIELMKPRVMSLVVFTAWVGLFVAPGQIHILESFIAIVCIAFGAGAAGALNMWYDRDIDAVMTRTKGRPLPSNRVSPSDCLVFALLLSLISVVILGVATNWVAGGLLAFSIFFYAVIYTMLLKRWTRYNIVIGGAAGAFPPMIGWAAVTGGVSLDSLIMFLIIFIWTPPHFWALNLFANGDYVAAKIPMMMNVSGEAVTKRQILYYSILLAGVATLPFVTSFVGYTYLVIVSLLNLVFVFGAIATFKENGNAKNNFAAKGLFGYSIIYLFFVFFLLAINSNLEIV